MNFSTESLKVCDKAKELGITSKELIVILGKAGYNYSSGNQILKSDALHYLFIESEKLESAIILEDSTENVILVNIGTKFAVVRILINTKMETKEISREVFESKHRAYYELNYLNSLLETGR